MSSCKTSRFINCCTVVIEKVLYLTYTYVYDPRQVPCHDFTSEMSEQTSQTIRSGFTQLGCHKLDLIIRSQFGKFLLSSTSCFFASNLEITMQKRKFPTVRVLQDRVVQRA